MLQVQGEIFILILSTNTLHLSLHNNGLYTMSTESASGQNTSSNQNSENNGVTYPQLFRIVHWLLAISGIVLFVTGLSLHATARPDWSLTAGTLPEFLLAGPVLQYHLLAAAIFAPSLIATLFVCMVNWKRWKLTHYFLVFGGLVSISSALVLLWPTGSTEVYVIDRLAHTIAGLVVFPLAYVWHVITGLTKYYKHLVPAFNPLADANWGQTACFVPLAIACWLFMFNVVPIMPTTRTLEAIAVPEAEADADNFALLLWEKTKPLNIELANGVGFDKGRTRVTLRAMYDEEYLFVKAVWDDPTEDRRYNPWQKTAQGWKQLKAPTQDEYTFYEDKFSLIFPIQQSSHYNVYGCTATCHANPDQGYGHKESAYPIDVWHWKSTRTDPNNQVDDKFWSTVEPENKDYGRFGDKKENGAEYAKNLSKDKSRPKMLPAKVTDLLDPVVTRDGALILDSPDTPEEKKRLVAWSEEHANEFPIGTILPGMLTTPFVGSRGDVDCISEYADGQWTVYMRRKLDTGNEDDVVFTPGTKAAFNCAAFDHAAKRHAYAWPVYWLELKKTE